MVLNCALQQTARVPTLDPARTTDPAGQRPRTTGPVPTVPGVPTSLSLSERNGGERVTPSLLTGAPGLGRTRYPGTPGTTPKSAELTAN